MKMAKAMVLILMSITAVVQGVTTLDTGISNPYQGKSTHNGEDFYTYYAQSFMAPEEWLVSLEIPLYENLNNTSKNNPDFTIELWDDFGNVLAASDLYDAPTNDKLDSVYYGIGEELELTVGDKYWAVYNPWPSDEQDAWCGVYVGAYNPTIGYYNQYHFAPTDTVYEGITVLAYRATFDSALVIGSSVDIIPAPGSGLLVVIGMMSLSLQRLRRSRR